MSREEGEQGKAWVENLLRRLARETGFELTAPFEWHLDFNHDVYRLRAEMNGSEKLWSFSAEKLEDCPNDKTVQRAIERSLLQYFIPSGQPPNATAQTSGPSHRSATDHLTEN